MTILVAGGTGFIGSALVDVMVRGGNRVVVVTRNPALVQQRWGSQVAAVAWGNELLDAMSNADAVINVAGENIAAKRWTAKRKRQLIESRLQPTRRLVEAIACAPRPPRVLLNASAIGYYGNRGDEVLSETSEPGSGFLAELCKQWERAALEASRYCRVVCMRFGVVLGRSGGMLSQLLPLASKLGTVIPGSGTQWLSWVALDDVVRAIEWLLTQPIVGAINIVAPQPVRMAELMRMLARFYRRPVWGRVPGWLLRLVLGEMASALTDSQRVVPAVLEQSGFAFKYPMLEQCLQHELHDRR